MEQLTGSAFARLLLFCIRSIRIILLKPGFEDRIYLLQIDLLLLNSALGITGWSNHTWLGSRLAHLDAFLINPENRSTR